MVAKEDYQPEYHAVFGGSRSGVTTVKNLIAALRNRENGKSSATIVWDSGNMSVNNVNDVESAPWKLISGIPKGVKQIRNILSKTEKRAKPQNFTGKQTVHAFILYWHMECFTERSGPSQYS